MIHSIVDQIVYLSTAFTLQPGDVLATGTPGDVGVAMDPPTFVKAEDITRVEIEVLGFSESRGHRTVLGFSEISVNKL